MYHSNSYGKEMHSTPQNTVYLGVFDAFVEPLVPPSNNNWPIFDTVDPFTYTPEALHPQHEFSNNDKSPAQTFYSPPSLTNTSSSTPQRRSATEGRDRNHIPRPRNAFMIYRSSFSAQRKIPTGIEHDHRHISRIIAHCWNNLGELEKQIWRDKADAEKAEHAKKYPEYRFSPVSRLDKPVKRRVRRNGVKDMNRCKIVADLLLAGKEGQDLECAIKQMDSTDERKLNGADGVRNSSALVLDVSSWERISGKPEEIDVPPFESPILPPSNLWQSQLPTTPIIRAADRVEDPPSLSFTKASMMSTDGEEHFLSPTSSLTEFRSAYQGYLHLAESSISHANLSYHEIPSSDQADFHLSHLASSSTSSRTEDSLYLTTWDPTNTFYHMESTTNSQYHQKTWDNSPN